MFYKWTIEKIAISIIITRSIIKTTRITITRSAIIKLPITRRETVVVTIPTIIITIIIIIIIIIIFDWNSWYWK
jgi:hypothetical protein